MVLVSVWTMGTSLVDISVFWAANVSEIVTISVFTTGGYGETEAVSVTHWYKRRPVWRHKHTHTHTTTATQHNGEMKLMQFKETHHYKLDVFGITHAAYKQTNKNQKVSKCPCDRTSVQFWFHDLWQCLQDDTHMQKHKNTALCGYNIRCQYIELLFLSILQMCDIYLCIQIISVALLKFLLLYL